MQKWEYTLVLYIWEAGFRADRFEIRTPEKTVRFKKDEEILEYINELGKKGWELVTTNEVPQQMDRGSMLWFKRPIE